MRRALALTAAALALAGADAPAPAPALASTLTVVGEAGRTAILSPADLAELPRERVRGSVGHEGAVSRVFEGARLIDVLRTVGAPLGARLHGPPATDLLVATGADGYRAVIALIDADPDSHAGAKVIVADRVDGAPLGPKEGPWRLVIDGDRRPTRSVHNLVRLEIRRLP